MIQFQHEFSSEEDFEKWLLFLKGTRQEKGLVQNAAIFHCSSDSCRISFVEPVVKSIKKHFPLVPFVGCTGNGNLVQGLPGTEHVAVTATFFEKPPRG